MIRALILDMDGVIWRGDQPIGDLAGTFDALEMQGLKVVLATNNSSRTPQYYQQRLVGFGVHTERQQIITSSQAAAHYLKQNFPAGATVYVVGETGLEEAVCEQGFKIGAESASAVVAGIDRQLTYDKLRTATRLIRSGASFIGTNPDTTFPTPGGLVPGAGAILAAIQAATGVEPVVVGKPSPFMYRVALEQLGTSPEETLVAGDRLETDIAGGQALGCPTALLLSGVSSAADAAAWRPPVDFIAADLGELVKNLTARSQGSLLPGKQANDGR